MLSSTETRSSRVRVISVVGSRSSGRSRCYESASNDFAEISDRRRAQVCGIMMALSGIELRGDGGTNGSR